MSVLLLIIIAGAAASPTNNRYLNGVTAVVGKKVVLSSDLKLKLSPHLRSVCAIPSAAQRAKTIDHLWKGALEDEIGQVLLEVEAQKHNIYIGANQINSTIRVVLKQNKFTALAQLKAKLAEKNYPYLLWRKDLRRHLLRRQLLADLVRSKVNIDEEAIKSYYLQKLREGNAEESVTFLELVLPKNKIGMNSIAAIKAAILKKVPFKMIIKKFTPNAGADGKRVDVTPGTYAPQFDRVLFPKNKKGPANGTIIGPVITAENIYFAKIIERKESGYLSYEKVRDRLKQELMNKKIVKKTDEWIKNLRSKYLVDVHLSSAPVGYLCK